jgi:hypothetical protein
MKGEPVNFAEKLALFSAHWSPRVVAEMNGYQFKLVKFQGEFVWHDHQDTDEAFIVLAGEMEVGFRERTVPVRYFWQNGTTRCRSHPTRADRGHAPRVFRRGHGSRRHLADHHSIQRRSPRGQRKFARSKNETLLREWPMQMKGR